MNACLKRWIARRFPLRTLGSLRTRAALRHWASFRGLHSPTASIGSHVDQHEIAGSEETEEQAATEDLRRSSHSRTRFLETTNREERATRRLLSSIQNYDQDSSAENPGLPIIHRKRLETFATAEEVAQAMPITREAMSHLVGDVHGIKPIRFSDGFVAKLFATRAFPLDMVIRGVGLLNVECLGPLALRELALRTETTADYSARVVELQTLGVQLPDVAFRHILRTFAESGQDELFRAVLATDQHPESFDDPVLQERLLQSFLAAGNWAMVQITLTALKTAGRKAEGRAMNRLLQHHILARDCEAIQKTMSVVQRQGFRITSTTVTHIFMYLLPPRPKGHPVALDDRAGGKTFAVALHALIYAQERGGNVSPRIWLEVLKRLGMNVRSWSSLEKLALWLGEHYQCAPPILIKGGKQKSGFRRPPKEERPLQYIFSRKMQAAIFVWGLRSAAFKDWLEYRVSSENDLRQPRKEWAQGLTLVQTLRRKYGLRIDDANMSRAFRIRMKMMFGDGRSTRLINKFCIARNRISLQDYIAQGCSIWGDSLMTAEQLRDRQRVDRTASRGRLRHPGQEMGHEMRRETQDSDERRQMSTAG